MAKTNEALLRIRAQNLAKKELHEVAGDLDNIAESQKKNATASGLAARALRELTDEQRQLAQVAAELARRGGIAGNLIKARQDVATAAAEVGRLRKELDQLKATKASGAFVGDIDKAIRNVEKSVRRASSELDRQTGKYQKIEASAAKIGISSENAAKSIAHINTEAARTEQLMVESANAVDRYNVALAESKGQLAAQEAAQKEITAEAARRNAVEAQAAAQRRAEAAALSAQWREQVRIREELTKRFTAAPAPNLTRPVLGPAGDVNAAALAREQAIRERLVAVIRRHEAAGNKLINVNNRGASSTRSLTTSLEANSRSLDRNNRLGGLFTDTGRKSLSVYQRLRGQLLATAAAYVGLYQAVNLVRSALTVEQERRRIDIQLKLANKGDAEAAKRDADFLRKTADELGLVYEDVAKNFANYKVAAASVGASNRTINASFREASEVVTGLALSQDDAEGVFRAFVQILGKARVQAEELRGQLGDRLPGAVAKFAEANNIALSDLDAYLKKGKGSVQDFLAFLSAYAKTTKSAAEENSRTLFAQVARLKNAYRDFLVQFAKAGTSNEVLKIINELIAKLKGEDGGKFARDLANAFAQVAKVVMSVIENFDKFIFVLKLFLGLQVAKAVVGIGSSLLVTGYNLFKAARAATAFTAELNAARIAGTALTGVQRALMFVLGPVGVAFAGVAAAILAMTKNSREATAELDTMIGRVRTLRTLSGEAAIAGINSNTAEIKKLGVEEAKLLKQRQQLTAASAAPGGNAAQGIRDLISAATDGTGSLEGVNRRLAQVRANIELLKQSSISTSKRLIKDAKARAAAEKAAAEEQDHFAQPKPEADDSGKDADKAAAAAERLAERQRDIADRAAQEILDINKALSEARLATEVTTQAQIDANLQEHLSIIDTEMEKRRTQLEGLKRDAEALGSQQGVANAQAALDKLPALEEVLKAKAKEDALTASIALKEKAVNDLIAQRDAEIEQINTKVELGLLSEAEGREKAIQKTQEYKTAIQGAIDALIASLMALPPDLFKRLGADEFITKLETMRLKADETSKTLELIGKNLGGQFAQGASEFLVTLTQGLAGGIEGVNGIGDAFQNALSSFRNFLSGFLAGIAQAILQAIILKAIMNAITGQSGGYTQAVVGALTGHTGGVVKSGGIGSGNPVRQVSAAMFAGAQRFHGGGLPGLKPNEVPAVLKKGEEVLSEDNPRNILNGGGAGGEGKGITLNNVNVFDREEMAGEVMKAKATGTYLLNYISRNARAINQRLGK